MSFCSSPFRLCTWPWLALLLAAAPANAGNAAEDVIEFTDERKCTGLEQERGECPHLEECNQCIPVDCGWALWSSWAEQGGCSGLKIRSRTVKRHQNECGRPCVGPKTESKKYPLPSDCILDDQQCIFGGWSDWSHCDSDLGQRHRARIILKYPHNSDIACTGPLNETIPCGERAAPKACEFAAWSEWTSCSTKCDGGYRMKSRRVLNHAEHGGDACAGDLQITESCNVIACEDDKNCTFMEWSDWTACAPGRRQRYRSRDVKEKHAGNGRPCDGPLEETIMCALQGGKEECDVSEWSAWSECDRACGGGQSYRGRILEDVNGDSSMCSHMPMHEVKPCNTQQCGDDVDCKLSEWSGWGNCSADCGPGTSTRSRTVLSIAQNNGKGCDDSTEEVRGCHSADCASRDCAWGDWDEWSACSSSCGGGSRFRDRRVKVAPLGAGKLCATEDKEEVAPCNTQSCGSCIDGAFLDWSEWTVCSATCDAGFRSRHREIGTHPNSCGKPVSGLTDEYEKCQAQEPCIKAVDCKLSEWSDWGDCSGSCSGVKERSRVIEVFASGTGAACVDESLKDVAPCSSDSEKCGAPTPKGCRLSDWSEWEPCSAQCDGGQRERSRSVLTPAQLGGEACEDSLRETDTCNTDKICDVTLPVDCLWGPWMDWGDCSRCGNQRYRHRSILQLPNKYGQICDLKDAKEIGYCRSECMDDQIFCTWGDWSSYSECSAMCGPSIKTRTRSLGSVRNASDYLFKNVPGVSCGGSQMDVVKCPSKDCSAECEPRNAEFSKWSDWSEPTCTQLCERYRVVSESASCGGLQAEGPLVETKKCLHDCTYPVDCQLSDWQEWTTCPSPAAQRSRVRTVLRMPANSGKPCEGSLKETAACSAEAPKPVNCDFGEWSGWSECSVSCGQGFKKRNRDIANAASLGGNGCEDTLEEVHECYQMSDECRVKDVDCEISEWDEWSSCDGSQQYTKRRVLVEASGNGKPCNHSLRLLKPCHLVVDCSVSDWSDWSSCDKECSGGQQQRQRQVIKHPNAFGASCPELLMETRGCNTKLCDGDVKPKCQLSEWTQWSECSATCGVASKTRSRFMTSAITCNEPLFEVTSCDENPECAYRDCAWNEWLEWSTCTCACGGGQRSRQRDIRITPTRGGKPCDLGNMSETEACNTHPCRDGSCIDGKLSEWSEWEKCSQTCEGGLTWRHRSYIQEANSCGRPAVGPVRETAACNADVSCTEAQDCVFQDWSDWSHCTSSCQGVKHRSRGIAKHARGGGRSCEGEMKQTANCNDDSKDSSTCDKAEAPVRNCVMGDWEEWSTCSEDCGGGQTSRVRSIVQPPQNGGKSCDGPLEMVAPCNEHVCKENTCKKQDCVWGDWEEWGSCNKCGGQQLRHRRIKQHAECGGAPCSPEASEETVSCKRICHELSYCGWTEWGEWGKCDKTCGKGSRLRERRLVSKTEERYLHDITKLTSASEVDLKALRQETHGLEARHTQDLIFAFAGGGLSISFVMVALRAWKLSSLRPRPVD